MGHEEPIRPFSFDELAAIVPYQRFRVQFEALLRNVVDRLKIEGKLSFIQGDLGAWREEAGRSGCRLILKDHPERSLFLGLNYAPQTLHPGMADLYFAVDLVEGTLIQSFVDHHGAEISEVARQLSAPSAGIYWNHQAGGAHSLVCLCSLADIACTANQPESVVRFFRHVFGSMQATGLAELYLQTQFDQDGHAINALG